MSVQVQLFFVFIKRQKFPKTEILILCEFHLSLLSAHSVPLHYVIMWYVWWESLLWRDILPKFHFYTENGDSMTSPVTGTYCFTVDKT